LINNALTKTKNVATLKAIKNCFIWCEKCIDLRAGLLAPITIISIINIIPPKLEVYSNAIGKNELISRICLNSTIDKVAI
jgi:hypothetical protein